MAVIEVSHLSMDFDGRQALDDVSFTVGEGTFFGCFGPNGAGKTTLTRILTGQLRATSGGAVVAGMDPAVDPLGVRSMVGIVPEVESPPSYLTASEFLQFVGRVRGLDDIDARAADWFSFFDLQGSEDVLCRDLSKGMRQKLLIAAALIHRPRLVFLDEPFINLDPLYQRKVRELLVSLRAEGVTIFMCSHILEIAQRLCDEVIIMDHGRVVANHRMADLEARGETLETAFMRAVDHDA